MKNWGDCLIQRVCIWAVHVEDGLPLAHIVSVEFASATLLDGFHQLFLQPEQRTQIASQKGKHNFDAMLGHDEASVCSAERFAVQRRAAVCGRPSAATACWTAN
jgi:hypothetical protein